MKLRTIQLKTKNVRAFTLLEVMASLVIVTMVILGPLTSAINASSYARQTKDVMISTYLAEEAIELLHFQLDSLYLECVSGVLSCDPAGDVSAPEVTDKKASEKAWWLFKKRMSIPGSSCFDSDGRSYDFLSMSTTTGNTASTYATSSSVCSGTSLISSAVTGVEDGGGLRNYYTCGTITDINDLRLMNGGSLSVLSIKKSAYSRKVKITSLPSGFETVSPTGPVNLEWFYDDLIVTAEVSFRRSNGVMRTIQVSDFLHIRS